MISSSTPAVSPARTMLICIVSKVRRSSSIASLSAWPEVTESASRWTSPRTASLSACSSTTRSALTKGSPALRPTAIWLSSVTRSRGRTRPVPPVFDVAASSPVADRRGVASAAGAICVTNSPRSASLAIAPGLSGASITPAALRPFDATAE